MNSKRLSAILLTFLALALMGPSLAVAEPTEDKEPPQVQGLTIEPAEVDTTAADQTVTVKAHITDNLSGFESGTIAFIAPGEKQQVIGFFGGFDRISGTATDGVYEATATFKRFSEAGTWKVNVVRLEDTVKNRSETPRSTLAERGLPYTVQVDPVPVTTAIAPESGPESGGTEVEISGIHLAGATAVNFGAAAAASFTVNSPNSITATAPPGSGTVNVVVTTPTGTSETSSADRFRYGPSVSLASSPNPSVRGQKITFTAKVTPQAKGAPTPTGTVAFVEGSTTLGIASLNSKGTAAFSTTALSAGEHRVVAEYGGDTYFGPSESPSIGQVVETASTELNLSSSLNPAPYGSSAMLSATVKVLPPGTGTPTGTVTFLDNGTPVATVPLVGKVAKYPLKSLAPGTHELQATYNGDGNYEASESLPLNQTIMP